MVKQIQLLVAIILLMAKSFGQDHGYASKLNHVLLPGIPDSVYEGHYDVYENRNTNKGEKISIYVVIIPSINKTDQPPIFCTEGGPGVAVTNGLSFYAERNNIYRQNNDVVLIDARGTGKSNPLKCPSLQGKENLEDQFEVMYPENAVKECYGLLSKQNDLKQYNTTNVVKDLEEIRKWLGYKKIHLYGLSYGTRVVLQYMRMYPAVIKSSVLWSPISANAKMPLYHAKFAQQSLDMIWKDCLNDSACRNHFPGIKNEFQQLMKRWKEKPVNYLWKDSSGNEKQFAISWNAFQTKIRSLMYTPAGIRTIPFIVHEAWKENFTPFISLYPPGKSFNDFIAEGFYLCVTCTEDVPFIKAAETEQQTKGSFVGKYRIQQQQQACSHWIQGVVPKNFSKPVTSTIPTLILSGSFDPVTPTSSAKEIAKTLPASKLVVIPAMSHIFDGLSNENCFDEIVMEFISHPDNLNVHSDCVKQMLPQPYKVN